MAPVAEIEINDLATVGNIRDVPGYQLPPEAFTEATNLRFYNEGVETIGGREQVFGTPTVAPHFAIPVSDASQTYWIYVSLTKGYVYDGAVHTDITRVSGDYTAGFTRDWNGTLLGGIPILNNGSDLPQYWPSINIANEMEDLLNFPATMRAKVMRAFGPYLIALNLIDNGVNYPHRVLWSHPADPGSLPASWDITDPDYDAGQQDLADIESGVIVDAMGLGGRMFIYKEGSVWRMTPTASEFIFDFKPFLETAGMLAPRCMTVTGDGTKQVFASQDDLMIHNGTSAESLLTKKYKKYLFNQIDTTNYRNCFMFTNPWFNEVWFCYPESGQEQPNRALVFNYREGGISESEVNFRNVAAGVIEEASNDTWATVVGTWDDQIGPWSESNRRKLVACVTDDTKLLQLDSGITFDGTDISTTLSREGLGVTGRTRKNEWIVDFTKMKFISRIWFKASGGPIDIRVGFADTPDGSITWTAAQSFDPTTQNYLDFATTGRALAIEFTATAPFRLEGYKLIGEITGGF
jgi:hypothetical protein